MREEVLELAIELGGQGLVGGEDEGRAAGLGDDLGGGKRLARAGDAEQDLIGFAVVGAFEQFGNGGGLVAGGGVIGLEAEGDAALVLFQRGGAVGLPRIFDGDDFFERGDGGRYAGRGVGHIRWRVKAGLRGFGEAIEIGGALDGVGLGFWGLERHACGGAAFAFRIAGLAGVGFGVVLALAGEALGFLGFGGSLRFLALAARGLVCAIQRALVAHALGVKGL